ncbi:MAG: CpXC domain-containing protein [Spirochaetia bacterium]
MKRDIVCHCGNTIQQDLPDIIDVQGNPQVIQRILEGSFMQVTCNSCGETLKPDFPVHFKNLTIAGEQLDLDYLPELERTQFFRNKIETSAQRVAIGYPELREKMLTSVHGLDDRALEILKFLLAEKALDKDLIKHSFNDITIILNDIGNNQLVFYVYGLKDEEVAIPRINMDLYNKVLESLPERLQSELYSEIANPPYVSINKIEIEAAEEEDS